MPLRAPCKTLAHARGIDGSSCVEVICLSANLNRQGWGGDACQGVPDIICASHCRRPGAPTKEDNTIGIKQITTKREENYWCLEKDIAQPGGGARMIFWGKCEKVAATHLCNHLGRTLFATQLPSRRHTCTTEHQGVQVTLACHPIFQSLCEDICRAPPRSVEFVERLHLQHPKITVIFNFQGCKRPRAS